MSADPKDARWEIAAWLIAYDRKLAFRDECRIVRAALAIMDADHDESSGEGWFSCSCGKGSRKRLDFCPRKAEHERKLLEAIRG